MQPSRGKLTRSQEYLHKGSLVSIEGRLQTNRHEQESETRNFTKVIAENIQMLDQQHKAAVPDIEGKEPVIE